MSSPRAFLIPATLTLAVCVVFYLHRDRSLAELEAALLQKRALLSKRETKGTPRPVDSSENSTPQNAMPRFSSERFREKALEVKARYVEKSLTYYAYRKELGDLLVQLADCTLDELFALADTLVEPEGESGEPSRLKVGILTLAAQRDPQAVLARPDVAGNIHLARQALGELAKKDPKAAIAWVQASGFINKDEGSPYSSFTLGERASLEKTVQQKAMEVALDKRLQLDAAAFVLENNFLHRESPLHPDVLEQAAAAYAGQQTPELRDAIIACVLKSASYYYGVDGMRDIAARHGIPNEDLGAFFSTTDGEDVMRGLETRDALSLMDEFLSEEQKMKVVPGHISVWAEEDYTSAAIYLDQMPASKTKDESVASFARKITTVDPLAAVRWAGEVSDAGKRDNTLRAVVDKWREFDPRSADAWVKEKAPHGLSSPQNAK